jgi:hypothetical protein
MTRFFSLPDQLQSELISSITVELGLKQLLFFFVDIARDSERPSVSS